MKGDMNGNALYGALRRRYGVLEYSGYWWRECAEGLRLGFEFRMGDVVFRPESLVERRGFLDFGVGGLDRMVFDIGMVELVSYWKCACAPRVVVSCGRLTETEVRFWRKLYWHGLGEFFYRNGIETSFEEFMELEVEKEVLEPRGERRSVAGDGRYLVPIGGGKDSVVTLEVLRRNGKEVRPLIMNPRGATTGCARVAGYGLEEVLVIRRRIDPTLLELNAKGYLNGHTPFSAMLAFYSRLASALSGVANVALSNESSANESTVMGTEVNHQYSKSLEFEDDFRAYCDDATMRDCDGRAFNYFSFLRPLSELQIAKLFSGYVEYHDVFRSCNAGSKEDVWCGRCAKCLFAYIILSPFIEPERLNGIFGKGMLEDETLRREFEQLVGEAETKPFECVGTVSEVRQALNMAIERWYGDKRPALLRGYEAGEVEPMGGLLPIGNLTEEERKMLEVCLGKKN